ncbi:hypothetical protein L484_013910 [Morus notabilis]|uniref:Subtilisin-like protease SDD1 n=1 Tax=Morus notabilis TaxID=981085 RepID=W9QIV9_9ROSA|nr:hypothetical protein L484_013910 [Morus notabilis]
MSSGGGSIGKQRKEVVALRDCNGHGTHPANTSAGFHVTNASLLRDASGTANMMPTCARVALYKVY